MLLKGKSAIIYGAAGHIGSAIARAFAREGATLFLAGRTLDDIQTLGRELRSEAAALDVLDEAAVGHHAQGVLEEVGRIDISVNAVSIRGDLQDVSLLDLSVEDFTAPVDAAARAHFITARCAARHMVPNRAGVILTMSSTAAALSGRDRGYHKIAGFGVACSAVEALSRTFAGELGRHNVRVVCLRANALPESWPRDVEDDSPNLKTHMEQGTALGRLPKLQEVGDAAAFAASDRASAITGAILNLTCGSIME